MTTDTKGLKVPYAGGIEVEVIQHLMTDYGKPSTYFEAKKPDGGIVFIHQNIVEAVQAGTYVLEPERVKGPRKVSTKKERAVKHVKECQKKRMSRGETIKLLQQKLRVSRGTAQTYYYAVK